MENNQPTREGDEARARLMKLAQDGWYEAGFSYSILSNNVSEWTNEVRRLIPLAFAATQPRAEAGEGGDAGDATVLRAHCRIHGETPSMTHSSREHWKRRAEKAEAVIADRVSPTPTPPTPEPEALPEWATAFAANVAAYKGPVQSFDVKDSFYLASCDKCGWIGSSEECGVDAGDDSDVYCPRCHYSGVDCGKVASLIEAPEPDATAKAVEEARAEERERCARIAEAKAPVVQCMSVEPVVSACLEIAAAIRTTATATGDRA